MPKLIYKDPDTGSQVVVEINDQTSEVTVGRNPGNIIRINNPSVSRRHTKFVYENRQVTLQDLNSSNGTYVNGMRIQKQVLEDGDLVRVGEFPLEFVDDVEPADTQVEDGQIAEAAGGSPMKSTHMGMGAMGMGDESGPGGAMATGGGEPTEAHDDGPQLDSGPSPDAGGEAPQEFILDEDDIEEVMESGEEVHATVDEDGFSDQTVESGAEIQASVEAMRGDGNFDGPADLDDDAKTKRADGDALAMQYEKSLQSGDAGDENADDAEIADLRQEVAELRADLEKAPDAETVQTLESERDEARQRADRLEDDLADSQQRLDVAQGDLVSRDDRIDELEGAVDELQAEMASRDEAIETLTAETQRLEQEVEQKQEQIEKLEDQLAEPGDGAGGDELRQQLREKEQELETLHREVAAFDEEREKKKEIFKELSGDLRNLVAKTKELSGRVEELEQQLESVTAERDSLLEKVDQLEATGGESGGSGGDVPDDYGELVDEKQALEETLAEVILERDRLEDELQQAREAS